MEERVKDSGGERNAQTVVQQGPQKIQLNAPKNHPAYVEGGADIAYVAFDEHHVGGLRSNLGPLSDAESHVGLYQRGRVVDPVADHCHNLSLILQLPDLFDLGRRERLGYDPIRSQRELLGNRKSGPGVVSGHHPDIDPHGFRQVQNGSFRVRFELVCNAHDCHDVTVDCGNNGGLAQVFQFLHSVFRNLRDAKPTGLAERTVSYGYVNGFQDCSRRPASRHGQKVHGLGQMQVVGIAANVLNQFSFGIVDNGGGQ
mmetsp:Transcript_30052/g.70854  ORF Transcript_30052/g.70854 Transcript_30052/m.70854 type:complete len:256 (-) Transcript_30052:317-1084(-)